MRSLALLGCAFCACDSLKIVPPSDSATRRKFGQATLGSILVSQLGPLEGGSAAGKTIVVTGATSGIGRDAAAKLSAAGAQVFVFARTAEKAAEAAAATNAAGHIVCDLSSLSSVREAAKAWGNRPIDVLCLNAGVAPATKGAQPTRTAEGFEVAVGTNHLGHFLLAHLLLKRLEASKDSNPRLIVTASSVHDPDTPGGDVGSKATLGGMDGLRRYRSLGTFDMVDGGAYDGDKSYKDSKLCNVLFTLEAQRRLTARGSKVTANCFSPGLITSTGLFRNQNPIFRTIFGFAATNVLQVGATVSQGGDTLAFMAQSPELAGVGGQFLATEPGKPKSAFEARKVSKEAQDKAKAKELWDLSAACVGLESALAV